MDRKFICARPNIFCDECVKQFYDDFSLKNCDDYMVLAAKMVLTICLRQLSLDGDIPTVCGKLESIFSKFEMSSKAWYKLESDMDVLSDIVASKIPALGIADGNAYETVYIWLAENFNIGTPVLCGA